jgi:hypothetical protein
VDVLGDLDGDGFLRAAAFGEFHHQADAEWIVIREPLRGYDDTTCGWPTLGQPIGRPGVGRP